MTLRVYDAVTGAKRAFVPVQPGHVGLYVCGLTVQDRPHLGHMFAFVACDVVRRYLEYRGFAVTHVQNFTDIDDKIIVRAREEGVTASVVAERNIAAYHVAARALMVWPAHHYPRVTEHIPAIVAFIERLVAAGHAYAAAGDVYFRVRSYDAYGRLSGRRVDDMRSGIRVEVGDAKEDPLDFALWKAAPPDEPGWASPWGRGRPGWHIECSVMATAYLGPHFDFHGGGRDLVFPHHENEVAQSCCATGEPYANFWLHNGMLNLDGRKMSKSDGNVLDLDGLMQRYPAEVIRFFLLSVHFRSQLDFGDDRLREAAAAYDRLRRGVRRLLVARAAVGDREAGTSPLPEGLVSLPGQAFSLAVGEAQRQFFAALDDDFNSGGALGAIFALVRDLNQYLEATDDRPVDLAPLASAVELLDAADQILGLFPDGLRDLISSMEIPSEVRDLVAARETARQGRDWLRADALRDEIRTHGFQVTDGPRGARVTPLDQEAGRARGKPGVDRG